MVRGKTICQTKVFYKNDNEEVYELERLGKRAWKAFEIISKSHISVAHGYFFLLHNRQRICPQSYLMESDDWVEFGTSLFKTPDIFREIHTRITHLVVRNMNVYYMNTP